MDIQSSDRVPTWHPKVVAIISLITIVSGMLVLLGWFFNITLLKNISSHWVSMKPNAAMAFIFSGSALWLLRNENTPFFARLLARICAVVVLIIGTLTLYEFIFHIDLGIDQLLFHDIYSNTTLFFPGRMSFVGALNFSLLGLTLLLLDIKIFKYAIPNILTYVMLTNTLFVLLTYIYRVNISDIYIYYMRMAIHTTLLFAILGVAILLVRSSRNIIGLLLARGFTGKAIREVLPLLFFTPIILGLLETTGEEHRFYSTELGQTLLITAIILFTNLIIWSNAATLKKEETIKQKAETDLMENEMLFREFAENINEVFWRTTPNMEKTLYVSPAYEEIWGRTRESLYKNPLNWLMAVLPEDRAKVSDTFLYQIQNNLPSVGIEYRISRPDGSIRNIYDRGFPLKNKQGQLISIIGIAADITTYKQAMQHTSIQQDISNLLAISDDIQAIAPKLLETLCTTLGWNFGELWLVDTTDNNLQRVDMWYNENTSISNQPGTELAEKIWRTASPLWIADISQQQNLTPLENATKLGLHSAFGVPILFKGKVYGVIDFFSQQILEPVPALLKLLETICIQLGEFIQNKYSEEKLLHTLHYDMLTNLINRPHFEKHINNSLMLNKPKLAAVIMLDIDRFGFVINALGRESGDYLLQLIAKKLLDIKSPQDRVARVAADRFSLSLLHVKDETEIIKFVHSLLNLFKDPVYLNDKPLFITLSVGIALYPQDGQSGVTLLHNAEIALELAKKTGGNQLKFFSSELPQLVADTLAMESELHHAILNKEFRLFYQPQVSLKTGEIIGLEALIRWQHQQKGLLLPDIFLPLAEEISAIIEMGEWAFEEVCQQIKANWCQRNNTKIPIAINISAQQLKERYHLLPHITELLKKYAIEASLAEIEITESVLLTETQHSLETLHALKDLGFQIALDDFGTGFSSLSYLQNIPTDKIKIDKSFIGSLSANASSASIVKIIISLSHILGKTVIAEGVETEEQLRFLIQEGCDAIQGFYFSPALPLEEIKALIASNKKLDLPH